MADAEPDLIPAVAGRAGPNVPAAGRARAARRRVQGGGLLCLVVISLAVVVTVPSMMRGNGATMEEGSIVEYATLADHGSVPVADYQTAYGPADVWVPAAVFAVTGPSVTVERIVGLAYRVLLLVGIFVLARRWGRVAATGSALVAWLVLAPYGALAYPWVGALAFGMAGVAATVRAVEAEDGRVVRWVAAGLLCGIALLFRSDLVVALALAAAVLVPVVAGGRRLAWFGGVVLGVAPYLVILVAAGPAATLRGLVTIPAIDMERGRHLPIPPNGAVNSSFFERVQAFDLGGHHGLGPSLPAQEAILFWLAIGALAVVAAWGVLRRPSVSGTRRPLVVAALSVGILPELLERLDVTHIRFTACVWLAFLPIAVVDLVPTRRARAPAEQRRVAEIRAGAAAAALVLVLIAALPFYIGQAFVDTVRVPPSATVVNQGRAVPVPPASAPGINWVLQALSSRAGAGQRVVVAPADLRRPVYNETYLYYLLPRLRPGTYYLEMNPGAIDAGRLARDLASSRWLILSSRWSGWSEPNASTQDIPAQAAAVVARAYCVVGRSGPYELLERRGVLAPGPATGAGPLACAGGSSSPLGPAGVPRGP